jgi:hypothetical protein
MRASCKIWALTNRAKTMRSNLVIQKGPAAIGRPLSSPLESD